MKKLFTLLALIATFATFAQAPQGFNYQATVRNSSGQLLLNQDVLVKFNILQNSATGDIVYSETQTATTDDLGHIALVVGQGTAPTGTFSTINWGTGNYYLGIEINTGSGYVAMGTTQLLSVPYALYANSSGNSQSATPSLTAVLAVNNSANSNKITNLADPTDAQDAVTKSFSEAQLQAQVAQLQAQITALVEATTAPMPNVTIGTQIWSSTNLDVSTYRDGTVIPQVTDPTAWAALTTGAWCYYGNDSANGATYGKLYNWYAVAGIHDNDPNTPNKILAPTGWHVSTNSDWLILTDYLEGNFIGGVTITIAGGKIKETGTNHWSTPNTDATNSVSFSGLPGGHRNYFGNFEGLKGQIGSWWSSTQAGNFAWQRSVHYNSGNMIYSGFGLLSGLSVRCVKD